MTQIDDLQARISRALDRIGYGLESFDPGAAGASAAAETEALRARAEAAEAALAEAEAALSDGGTEAEQVRAEMVEALAAAQDRQDAAVSAAVDAALAKADEERTAAIAAIRAEAEAAIAAAAKAPAAPVSAPVSAPVAAAAKDTSQDWSRVEDELRVLREALEDEKLANAQLTERMRHLKEKMLSGGAAAVAGIAAETAGPVSADVVAQMDIEVQRLRAANAALAESNAKLREANAMGVGDTQLINKALAAELESMRANRAVDAAETRALIEVLEPLLAEAGVMAEEASA